MRLVLRRGIFHGSGVTYMYRKPRCSHAAASRDVTQDPRGDTQDLEDGTQDSRDGTQDQARAMLCPRHCLVET